MSGKDRGRRGGKERRDGEDSGRRRPVGIERAQRSEGALPPRASGRGRKRTPKPDIPAGIDSDVPSSVWRELKGATNDPQEVAKALTIAGDAMVEGNIERALTYLHWAKDEAGRAPAVREALGIALYHAEDYGAALSELQTYRRLSGRTDQNHLIADCLRATGRPPEKVGEAVQEMDPDEDGIDRLAEGVIVWASALADGGDVEGGRTVLRQLLEDVNQEERPVPEHVVRLWYVAGDLAERSGAADQARRWFQRVADISDDLYDVSDRLRRLPGE